MQLTRPQVILYKKSRATNVEISVSNESWITDLQINTFTGQMVIVNVYIMPTSYGDTKSVACYRDCLQVACTCVVVAAESLI